MTQQLEREVNQYTAGSFADEPASCLDLDARLAKADCFRVYPEVPGYYTQPRAFADEQQPRIDRLLIPKANLLSAGWTLGAVGIEAKASSKKIGPIIAQALDYSRAVFVLPESHVRVCLSWVFIWPLDTIYGDTASMMANFCIGEAFGNGYTTLKFSSCGKGIFTCGGDGQLVVRMDNRGRKVGSR